MRLYRNGSQQFVPNEVVHRPDGVTEIQLTRGYVALVDTADYPLVREHRWTSYTKKGRDIVYAGTGIASDKTKTGRAVVMMHRLLFPSAKLIDHRDGNGLNNRRENFREANHSLNGFNRKSIPHGSKYHGVNWCRTRNIWYARIKINGVKKHIGMFKTEDEAYAARLVAEKKYYPNFERTNR